ncbi:multidrug effflux MFS transporter [Myroides indicus]|uniref:Polar amino acid transport system substrate-binding protein n=1 Tax=Myroides indicus TaxID=1323422 RepID=A0A4R7ERJ4_9FLAO|nr:multidrug effflux MFS transporter [Myroides indicus]TDS51279.1 polar amino acid transport system substrate-binding protein [Myroides indicus]
MKQQTKSFIWLIIFLVGFPQISETIYTPSLNDLAHLLNVSANDIQKTLSIYFAGFAIGVFLWGILSDFIGRKRSMLIGIAIYLLGSFLCLRSTEFHFFLLARFIQAVGAAVGSNVSQTILRDVYNEKERVGVFSTISAVLAFSPAIGPMLGSIVASIWNVSMVFRLLMIIGSIAFIWSLFGLKETLNVKTKINYNFHVIGQNILKDRLFWIYGGIIGVVNGVIFSYYGEAPFIFIEMLRFSIVEYGYIGFVVALASFSGARFCKSMNKKISNYKILTTGNFVFFVGIFIFFFAVTFLEPSSVLFIIILLLAIFIIMFGLACLLPVCLSNVLLHHKNYLGIAGAFLGLYYYVVVCVITLIMSWFHSPELYVYPLFLLFWFLVNWILMMFNRK